MKEWLPHLASLGDGVSIPKLMLCPRVLEHNEDTLSEAEQEFGEELFEGGQHLGYKEIK